jgi:hypothetical protein
VTSGRAASTTADKKFRASLSKRVAMRRKSLRCQMAVSILQRYDSGEIPRFGRYSSSTTRVIACFFVAI